jgi:hypothetical protein
MERLPAELIYIIIFIGIVLFNVFTQRAARRRQAEQAAQAPPADALEEPPADEMILEDVWGRRPEPPPSHPPVYAPRPPSAVAPPAAPPTAGKGAGRPRHPVRALLAGKHDLRRAVVLTMVLGPCRSQERGDDGRP